MHQIGLQHLSALERSERGCLTSLTLFEYHTKNKQHTCYAPVTYSYSCANASREIKKKKKRNPQQPVYMISSAPPIPFLFPLRSHVVDHPCVLNPRLELLLHTNMHTNLSTHTYRHDASGLRSAYPQAERKW